MAPAVLVNHNLCQMNGPMARVLGNESLGGNAGRVNLGGRYYSCAAARGFADPQTGRIAAFGNVQDIPLDIRAANAEFTLKVAFGGLRFFRIVEVLDDGRGGGPRLSPGAREVIEESVHRWNESRERSHTMSTTPSRDARLPLAMIMTAMLVAFLAMTQTSAAVLQQPPAQPDTNQGPAMGPGMGRMMTAERQEMMANMKAMDTKLNDLVAKMTAARGEERVDAIAAVVQELVTQRTQMHDQMMSMQDRMMGQMMQHKH